MPDDEPHYYVPLGNVLNRIEDNVVKIRDKLDSKADATRVAELERRTAKLEGDSVSKDAVEDAVQAIKGNRSRFWLAVCLACVAQMVNITLFVIATTHH